MSTPATASVRDLRNRFPEVRKLVESEGEVLLTESGKPKYRLLAYSPVAKMAPPLVDYWRRLNSYQPTPMSAAASQSLHEENRGDR